MRTHNSEKIIFTFWEPRTRLPPYLSLCLKTWERNLPGYNIRVLDYSTLGNYISRGVYDMAILEQLPLPIQKDAILFALLQEHGGTFMDIDTIVLNDITPIVDKLASTEVVMFSKHLAFMSAKAGAHILTLGIPKIRKRLAALKDLGDGFRPSWDFLGNAVLAEVKEDIIESFSRNNVLARLFNTCMDLRHPIILRIARQFPPLNNLIHKVHDKRTELFIRAFLKPNLAILDAFGARLIPEGVHFNAPEISPEEKYKDFWFGNTLNIDTVFSKGQRLIALHNSWTPQWYKDLSEKEVLEYPCLLSKTIRFVLGY